MRATAAPSPRPRGCAAAGVALVAGALAAAALADSGDAGSAPAGAAGGNVAAMRPRDAELGRPAHTRSWRIAYRAHTGRTRLAYVLLPSWYGPERHPSIPLVISPHG